MPAAHKTLNNFTSSTPAAIRYVAPHVKLQGDEQQVFDSRDAKLEAARLQREQKWKKSKGNEEETCESCYNEETWTEDKALLGSNRSAHQVCERRREPN